MKMRCCFSGIILNGPLGSYIKNMGFRRIPHPICNLAVAVAIAAAAYGCRKEEDSGKKKSQQAMPVSVTKAISQNIPWNFDTFGSVEAFSNVNINTLVGGKIIKVGFVPGQKVKKGDILALIDARP